MRAWLDRRPAALPLLALGALLIAVAAGPSPSEASWTGLPDTTAIRWFVGAVVFVLAALGLVILLATRTISARGGSRRRSWLTTMGAILLIGLVSLIDFEGELPPEEQAEELPLAGVEPTGPPLDPGPGYQAGDLTALVIILVVAVALLIWTRRGRADQVDEGAEEGEHSPIGDALARAREHLLDGDDPRQAVLLAYRDLERTLESLDLPRDRSETPTEHLARALDVVSIRDPSQAEPLIDLADLYARARYSDHRITRADQRRAADDLGRARLRLVGTD